MSKWLRIKITAKQRISLGVGNEKSFLTRTHPYLPGSVVRGALAATWLRESNGTADSLFTTVFEQGRFSPAFPSGAVLENQSVKQCKYHDGNSGHPEFVDLAFDHTGNSETHCGAGRDDLKGNVSGVRVGTRVTTALDPGKNTASEGKLFSREYLEKGTVFAGYVCLPDSADAALDFLMRISSAFFGGRSSVMGRSDIKWEELSEAPGLSTVNTAEPVVIRTISPTILVDSYGLPSIDLAAALQEASVGTVEATWSNPPRVESGIAGGWHMATGLPKPAEIALVPGAVAKLTGVDLQNLKQLLDSGLGLRTNEGYGWVEVVTEPWAPTAEGAAR
ncbi:MAG: hypothetical protein GX483_04845 [Actinomycetaceae bacterium]|nr:hypothetical protein [Actinomycetaceae bacterium]